ncbi:MAG: zinc-binding dehydrogenase [Nocardiopsaceae bacterium]|nr:zinc-binding dehydrogenase [Nocardiopsaceae bacterium]
MPDGAFVEAAADVDVVLDTIGGENGIRSLRTVRKGGVLVTILPGNSEPLLTEAKALGVRAEVLLVEADHAGMAEIAALVEEGELRPEVSAVFPLEQAAEAHRLGEAGRTTGETVLTLPEG